MIPHCYQEVFHQWFTYKSYYTLIAERLAKLNRLVRIAEIGVLEGAGTSFLAVELLNRGVDFDITAHDNFAIGSYEGIDFSKQKQTFLKQMKRAGVEDNVEIIVGDSADTASAHKNESLDFVFVDGDHSFLGIAKDFGSFYPKLKRGGIMGGHDYIPEHPAVWAFANELNKTNPELNMETFLEPDNIWSITKP